MSSAVTSGVVLNGTGTWQKWIASLISYGAGPIRIFPTYEDPGYSLKNGFDLYFFNWACRFKFTGVGVFGNGSKWFSGWFNWREENERLYGKNWEEDFKVWEAELERLEHANPNA